MSDSAANPDVLAMLIADAVGSLARTSGRQLVAIAGPPGAGKSTVAAAAQKALDARGTRTGLISMDGFHYDNAILSHRDLLAIKGAPETFDFAGFHAALVRLLAEPEVAIPEFDRSLDKAIAASSLVTCDQRIVLVEGNYLLLDEPEWADLHDLWTLKIFLDVDLLTLEARLTERWVSFGLNPDAAKDRALANDIPNARRVVQNSVPGDIVLR